MFLAQLGLSCGPAWDSPQLSVSWRTWVSQLNTSHLTVLAKGEILHLHSEAASQGQGPQICIFNMLPR